MKHTTRHTLAAMLAAAALPALAAEKALTPIADNNELSIDKKVEVAYSCTIDKKTVPMTVMYGIKGNDIIVAQVKVGGNISPGLFRVPDANNLLNIYQSATADGTMWTTLPATPATLKQIDGGKLSYRNGESNTIILDKCRLDKAATAKLKN